MEAKVNWDMCTTSKTEDDSFFDEVTYKLYTTSQSYNDLVQKYSKPVSPPITIPAEKPKPVFLNPYQMKQALMSPKPSFPFPRFSNLTKDEQKNYLVLLDKLKHFTSEMYQAYHEQAEIQYFLTLKRKVIQEQEEFNRYLEYIARNSPKDYQFLNAEVNRYVEDLLIEYEKQASMYPVNYKLHQTLGITTGMPFPTDSMMKHIKTLITMGSVPYMTVPYYENKQSFVSRHYNRMTSECSPVDIVQGGTSQQCTHQAVSKDSNARKLAPKYQVDIVISTSGLETLIDNHSPCYENQWEIPITVKEHKVEQEDGNEITVKTVYIDKPLLRRDYLTNKQKSHLFHKISFPRLFKVHRMQVPKTLQKLHEIFHRNQNSPALMCEPSRSADCDSGFSRETFPAATTTEMQFCGDTGRTSCESLHSSHIHMTSTATINEEQNVRGTGKVNEDNRSVEKTRDPLSVSSISQIGSLKQSQEPLPGGSSNQVSSCKQTQDPVPSGSTNKDEAIDFHLHVKDLTSSCFTSQMKVPETHLNREQLTMSTSNLLSDSGSQGDISESDTGLVIDIGGIKSCDSQDEEEQTISHSNQDMQVSKHEEIQPKMKCDTREGQGLKFTRGKISDGTEEEQEKQTIHQSVDITMVKECDETELDISSPPIRRSARLQAANSPGMKDKPRDLTETDVAPSRKRLRGDVCKSRGRKTVQERIGCNEVVKVITQCTGIRKSRRLESETDKCHEDTKEGIGSNVDKSEEECGAIKNSKGGKGKRKSPKVISEDDDHNERVKKQKRGDSKESLKDSVGETQSENDSKESLNDSVGETQSEKVTIPDEDLQGKERSQNTNTEEGMMTLSQTGLDTKKDVCSFYKAKQHASDTKQSKPADNTVESILQLKEKLDKSKHTVVSKKGLQTIKKEEAQVPGKAGNTGNQPEWLQTLLSVVEDSKEYVHPHAGNVAYDLWSFGKLRVLIRSRVYGYIKHEGKIKLVIISPKLEYQPLFGLEHTSIGQLSREWIKSYIQPESIIVRGHINAYTSEVMLLEKLDTSTLLSSSNFNPAGSMKMLHTVFEKLKILPVGQFLLSHSRGDLHVCIHQTVDSDQAKRGTYNLGSKAKTTTATSVSEWLPLDTNLMTSLLRSQERIPATFPPYPDVLPKGTNTPQQTKRKGRKKKKGKNMKHSK